MPVAVIDDPTVAHPLADSLIAGGLPLIEITLRTDAALPTIRSLAQRNDIAVGAGTILDVDGVRRAAEAGASFAVSPGYSDAVAEECRRLDMPWIPGVATATEVMNAASAGYNLLKVYPAAELGGPAFLRSLAGPFPSVSFMATGGISPTNLTEYLSIRSVAAVGGTWLTDRSLLSVGDFDSIARNCANAVSARRWIRPES